MSKKKVEKLPAKKDEDLKTTSMDAFAIFDALDENQIIEEIKGKVLRDWIYQFSQEGRTVQGVSKAGIDAACQYLTMQGKVIRDQSLEMINLPDGEVGFISKCAVYSVDRETGREYKQNEAIGTKNQPIYFPGGKKNPHWFTAGSQKSIRNARRRLIPESVINHILAEAVKEGRVRQVGPGDQKQIPPGEDPGSKKLPAKSDNSTASFPKDKMKSDVQSMLLQISGGDPDNVLPLFQEISGYKKFDDVPESEYPSLSVKARTALDRWKTTGSHREE